MGTGGAGDGVIDSENDPPTFYTADQSPCSKEEDTSESEGEEEEEEEEWENVEVVGERGRRRGRLNYESSYLDYMALGASSGPPASPEEEREGGRGEGEEGGGRGGSGVGLFRTLSSLWTSTFTRSTH